MESVEHGPLIGIQRPFRNLVDLEALTRNIKRWSWQAIGLRPYYGRLF